MPLQDSPVTLVGTGLPTCNFIFTRLSGIFEEHRRLHFLGATMNDMKWSDAPEVATHMSSDPEVYYPVGNENQPHNRLQNPLPAIPLKSFDHAAPNLQTHISPTTAETPSTYYPQPTFQPTFRSYHTYDQQSAHSRSGIIPPAESQTRPSRNSNHFWGCSTIILILSIALAIFFAATIGLAAGTALQTNRAHVLESKLSDLVAKANSTTSCPSNETSSTDEVIDGGCSADPRGISGTQYTSDYSSKPSYSIYCNSNAPNPPLMSLFVGNFYDCIDACALYTAYTAGNFPNTSNPANSTCAGVSFIPNWTNRTTALTNNAPGNCYLKPGPQNTTALTPGGGTDAVHAAILG